MSMKRFLNNGASAIPSTIDLARAGKIKADAADIGRPFDAEETELLNRLRQGRNDKAALDFLERRGRPSIKKLRRATGILNRP